MTNRDEQEDWVTITFQIGDPNNPCLNSVIHIRLNLFDEALNCHLTFLGEDADTSFATAAYMTYNRTAYRLRRRVSNGHWDGQSYIAFPTDEQDQRLIDIKARIRAGASLEGLL